MNIKRWGRFLFGFGCFALALSPFEASAYQSNDQQVHQGELGFPEFVEIKIKGAPILSAPFMVSGSNQPLLTEKHGLAAPALWDWNGDGKQDLLLGEFETGDDESNIRVYLNVGTKMQPEFTDEFEYAKDTEGNVIAVPQW